MPGYGLQRCARSGALQGILAQNGRGEVGKGNNRDTDSWFGEILLPFQGLLSHVAEWQCRSSDDDERVWVSSLPETLLCTVSCAMAFGDGMQGSPEAKCRWKRKGRYAAEEACRGKEMEEMPPMQILRRKNWRLCALDLQVRCLLTLHFFSCLLWVMLISTCIYMYACIYIR